MLKVTVEILSPGRNGRGRVIAVAKIGRLNRGVAPDNCVELLEDLYSHRERAMINKYPRFAASVWDLVARSIAVALTGEEKLPPRPQPLKVPVHRSGNTDYVRLKEIPEPVATKFRKRIEHSSCPVIEEDATPMECAYASDWLDFLSGRRKARARAFADNILRRTEAYKFGREPGELVQHFPWSTRRMVSVVTVPNGESGSGWTRCNEIARAS